MLLRNAEDRGSRFTLRRKTADFHQVSSDKTSKKELNRSER